MSCVLRVSGETFDVDRFLATSQLHPCAVWHVGEKHARCHPPCTTAGFNIVVNEASIDDFPAQVQNATRFLRDNRDELQQLSQLASVSDITLDFAIAHRNEAAKYCRLPPELIQFAGEFRMGIELSYYACVNKGAGD